MNCAGGNSSAFAFKCHSLAVSSMRALINCATGRVNSIDNSFQLVNAFINNVACVQRSMLWSNTLSSPLYSAILVNSFQ